MFLPNDFIYNILVVGCGGTGSQLLPSLMQLCSNLKNINEIILADADVFENKNLNNQRCTRYDINQNKAKICCERYKLIFPKLNLSFIDKYITSENDISKIFHVDKYIGHLINIIVGCVDNNATRKILYNYSINNKKTIYIDSGNDSGENDTNRDGQIIIGCNIEFRSNGDEYKYNLPFIGDIYEKEIKENIENIENVGTCMRITNDYPQNIATNVMAASILMSVITNLLMFNKIENNIIYFDANKLSVISR